MPGTMVNAFLDVHMFACCCCVVVACCMHVRMQTGFVLSQTCWKLLHLHACLHACLLHVVVLLHACCVVVVFTEDIYAELIGMLLCCCCVCMHVHVDVG